MCQQNPRRNTDSESNDFTATDEIWVFNQRQEEQFGTQIYARLFGLHIQHQVHEDQRTVLNTKYQI